MGGGLASASDNILSLPSPAHAYETEAICPFEMHMDKATDKARLKKDSTSEICVKKMKEGQLGSDWSLS